MTNRPTALLESVTVRGAAQPRVICVALAHNEYRIIAEFLRHYRSIGVEKFLIVDDHSTDGTREYLCEQQDIDVFSPVEGSTYSRDKRNWRAQLLDTYCDGIWSVVPDIDEHLVYKGIETIDLVQLAGELEREGVRAMHATMVDMYNDAPLARQCFNAGTLRDAFPMFDGPENYFRIASPRNFRKKYPTPFYFVIGGMRQRLFEPLPILKGSREHYLLHKLCGFDRNIPGTIADRIRLGYARFFLRSVFKSVSLYNCSKIPLIKWSAGLHYYNGAHALSQYVPLSRRQAVLLHFKFAGGVETLVYNAERGQHTAGSSFYRSIVDQQVVLNGSPVFAGTRTYDGTRSLGALIA